MNIIKIWESDMDKIDNFIYKECEKNGLYRTYEKAAQLFEEHGFIFDDFRLYLMTSKDVKQTVYKVEIDKDVLYVKRINLNTNKGMKFIFSFDEFIDSLFESLDEKEGLNGKQREEVIRQKLKDEDLYTNNAVLMNTLIYVTLKGLEEPETILVEETTRRYTKSESSRKAAADVTRVYSLTDCVRKYTRHVNHCKHVYTCEHWEVRGHYRHLKSGKTIYVRPFEKGRNKNAGLKDKVYKI